MGQARRRWADGQTGASAGNRGIDGYANEFWSNSLARLEVSTNGGLTFSRVAPAGIVEHSYDHPTASRTDFT